MKYNEELLLRITLGVYKFFHKLLYVFIRTSTFIHCLDRPKNELTHCDKLIY